MSKGSKVLNFIKKVDQLGSSVNLQVNNGDNFKTLLGVVMTILYFSLLGAYTVAQFIQMADKSQGSSAQSLILQRDSASMNITFQPGPLGYRFAIGFRNPNFDETYGKFYAKQVNSTIDYVNIQL